MKLFIESEELIGETNKIVAMMQENVILHPTTNEMSLDEIRHISTKRLYNLIANQLMTIEKAHVNPRIPGHLTRMLSYWDPATYVRYKIGNITCLEVLRSLGCERHNHYVQDTLDGKALGCFCVTEIAHGTNTKALRTVAVYDSKTLQFILNTPDFQAAKCWAGNLAILKGQQRPTDTPLKSVHYLANAEQILNTKFNAKTVQQAVDPIS
ncbi:uncharacterized protein CBL_00106 [Carabus blaptoides fortunei]